MGKLVILELEGDFDTAGFRATLEIRSENEFQALKVKGYLPSAPEMATQLQRHWQETYRALGTPLRIKGQKIIHKGSINRRITACRKSAHELRDRFRIWLNAASFQPVDRRLREELSRTETIRFLIRTRDLNLQKLPWHEWDFFERYPKAEVALSAPEYEFISAKAVTPGKTKVSILAILGDSRGVNLETDRNALENLPDAAVTFLVEPDRQQLSDQLWEGPWDILFFAGHSETEGETGRIYINPTDSLTLSELNYGLRKAIDYGLQLAIGKCSLWQILCQPYRPIDFRMTLQKLPPAIAGLLASSLALPYLSWLPIAYAQGPPPAAEAATADQRPPAPPRTPPINGTRPGGGLNPTNASCSALNDELRALIPIENPVLTTAAYPTFLFYVPFGREEVQFGEFSLLPWPGETTRHYQTRFTLPESPGIVSVTLPELPAYALAEAQTYRWYFQLYCQNSSGIRPDLTLNGAVQRVALTPKRSQQIQAAIPEIWYDALANVAHQLQMSPQDADLQNDWITLLQSINAEDLATMTFSGSVLSLED